MKTKGFLKKRNGVFYLRVQIHGREIYQSLKTRNESVAKDRAKAIMSAAREKQFEKVRAVGNKGTGATLGDLVRVYGAEASARGLRPATISGNIACLRKIVAASCGEPDQVRVAELARQTVTAYVAAQRPETSAPDALARSRRTVKSKLRQARSLFTPWALEAYEDAGLSVSVCPMFMKAQGVSNRGISYQYERPPQNEVDSILAAAAQLETEAPELYAVFLLVYPVAMRATEAAWARLDWLVDTGNGWEMRIPVSAEFQTKSGRSRAVPVHPDVVRALQAQAARSGTGYILPGASPTARDNLVARVFSEWMHNAGWKRRKAAQELRALMGCRWFTEQGAEVAQALLGHKSVATTCQYYARYSRPVPALSRDW